MAFGTIDDRLDLDTKFIEAGLVATGLWTLAIAWSNRNRTEGFISYATAEMLSRGSKVLPKTLLKVALWDKADGGYQFHNFFKNGRNRPAAWWDERRADKVAGGIARAEDAPREGGRFTSRNPAEVTSGTSPFNPVTPKVLTDLLRKSPPSASARDGAVERVFSTWQNQRHPTAKLTPERRRVIKARLKHYSEDDLTDAIVGVALDPFSMGQNDKGKVWDDLGLILRDAAHVEKFVALARGETPTLPTNEVDRRVLALLNSAAAKDDSVLIGESSRILANPPEPAVEDEA